MDGFMILGIVLLAAGFLFVGIETLIPGFGAPGILGGCCLVAGVFLIADSVHNDGCPDRGARYMCAIGHTIRCGRAHARLTTGGNAHG